MNAAVLMAMDSNVIDKKVHGRLIADIDRIATLANIPKKMILTSMKQHCTAEEIQWVRNFRNHDGDKPNLAYVGHSDTVPVESRMMAVAGALLRNFIDARVMTVQEVLALSKDGEMPEPTVLLIPNFFVGKDDGGNIASWEVSTLLGLLIQRLSAGKLTALYVQDLKQLEVQYGKPFVAHIKNYFQLIP